MDEKRALWDHWIGETLLADIDDSNTLDPIPLFELVDGTLEMSPELEEYRWGKNDGEYLYLVYLLDEPVKGVSDIVPVYVGESRNISQRSRQHAQKIMSSLPTDEWEDTGDWGSFSKYDHMALIHERASNPLYIWIIDVDTLDHSPYGHPTYRQELEAMLVGLARSQSAFEGVFANREFVPNRISHEIGKAGPAWVSLDSGDATVRLSPSDEDPVQVGRSLSQLDESKADLWEQWVASTVLTDVQSADTADPIPLFDVDPTGQVRLTDSGSLTRSAVVDERIRLEGKRCLTPDGGPNGQYDGLIYLLYQLEDDDGEVEAGDIIPRYFGKAEIYGKKCELSSNFEEIAGDRDATRSFARWGDGKYWHVGELSMSLRGESKKKTHWVEALFEDGSRTLKRPTYLWVRAWDATDDVGPYGVPATLAEVEPLLIGLAYGAYPNQLLNKSGTPDDAPIKVSE